MAKGSISLFQSKTENRPLVRGATTVSKMTLGGVTFGRMTLNSRLVQ
jgi:hypothetical protein